MGKIENFNMMNASVYKYLQMLLRNITDEETGLVKDEIDLGTLMAILRRDEKKFREYIKGTVYDELVDLSAEEIRQKFRR